MTETEVESELTAGASNIVYNGTIVDVLMEQMGRIPPPSFSEEEVRFAREMSATFPKGGIDSGFVKLLGPDMLKIFKEMQDALLFDGVLPAFRKDVTLPATTRTNLIYPCWRKNSSGRILIST